ncbi:MAG TPA: hypothetical protein ENH85_11300 [Candidatus Scalindua sp.]|nr:hypothetical protein [Candidatus Scalindua sp.]
MPYKSPALQRKYQREWVAKKKVAFLSSLSCSKCGNNENLRLFSRIPGTPIKAMKPWNNPDVPRINYKALCSSCIPTPKPRKRKPRKRISKPKINEAKIRSDARIMALRAQKMLQQRREKNQ